MGFPWRSLVFSRNREFCWILCDFCSILFSSEHKSAKKIPARPKIAALTRRRSATSRVCAVKTLAAVSLFVLFNCYVHHRVGYRNFHAKDWKIRRLYFSQLKDRYGVAPTLNVKLWNFEKLKILPSICQKLDLTHWPKPPLPCSCPSRGGGRLDGSLIGPRCLCRILCNLIGPRCLCEKNVYQARQAAPSSLMRGLCWNHRFRPSCACVLPLVRAAGPLLEPLVPPLVLLRAAACEQNWTKFVLAHVSNKISQNFVDRNVHKHEENWTRKQQNSTKFCWP